MTEETGPRRDPLELRYEATVDNVDFEQRIIEVIAVPYGQEAVIEYRGELMRETVDPGAFDGIESRNDPIPANREHNRSETFGRVIAADPKDPRGLRVSIRASRTPKGDDALQLAADGILRASVGMRVRPRDQILRNGLRRIRRAFLDHISLVESPAYDGAAVLAVRDQDEAQGQPVTPTPVLDGYLEDPVIAAVLAERY